MIVLNKNHGLMNISEEGSESSHKEERNNRYGGLNTPKLPKLKYAGSTYRGRLTWCQVTQTPTGAGHTSTVVWWCIRHKWAAGDPGVRSLDRQPWCSICNSTVHFTRGCKAKLLGPMGRELDVMVMELLCTSDNEPECQKGLLDNLWWI